MVQIQVQWSQRQAAQFAANALLRHSGVVMNTTSNTTVETTYVLPECSLISDTFDYAMQMLLFVVCMGSLLLKWHMEVPQRKLLVFFMDLSKQMVAAVLYHFLNMVQAILLDMKPSTDADPCAWYWVTFMLDCTVGLVLTLCFVKLTERLFNYDSGMYGDGTEWESNLDLSKWMKQVLVYCGIAIFVKVLLATMLFSALDFWDRVGKWGTAWIRDPQLRLLDVMVITPGCMDTLFFWITDEFIKHTKPPNKV